MFSYDHARSAKYGRIGAVPTIMSTREIFWSVCALYWYAHRIATFASASRTMPTCAPGRSSSMSAMTNAKAEGWNISDCRDLVAAIVAETVPVAPTNDTAALFAGEAVTVWSGPDVMMLGEMFSVTVDDPEASAVMTNCCRSFVSM